MAITKQPLLLKLLMLTAALLMSSTVIAEQPAYKPVQPRQLDMESYAGYKLFRNWCARCHGNYGQGLAGPDLAKSMRRVSKPEFMRVVALGKNGKTGVMPGWKANKAVMEGREKIYSYLKARSDGLIGEIEPVLRPQ